MRFVFFALAVLVLAPEAIAQVRVSRTVEVPTPVSGDYPRAEALLDASGGVVLAVPFGVFLSVSRSVDGVPSWTRSTDDEMAPYGSSPLTLARDGDGVALGIVAPQNADLQSALGLRLGPDGSERARTTVSVTLPADIRTNPNVIEEWREQLYSLRPIDGDEWLAVHAGETRAVGEQGDTTGVEVLAATRLAADGAVAWSGAIHVAPTAINFDPNETARGTVIEGLRATLPIDMTAYIGSASQSFLADLDLATGAATLAPGFESVGTGYDGARPGTTFFGATPSGRRVRIGLTGTQNTFRNREGTTMANTEWFVEADGMERATSLTIGTPDPDIVCDWGGDLALLSTRWAENYQRALDLQVIAADGTISERQEVVSVPISETGIFTHRVLACGEVGDALRVVVAGSYRTYGDSALPPATVTAYDLVR